MPGLFDPITIKGLTLKNRLVMPPMGTKMGIKSGEITDRHISHYTARARGGVGLIIIEHCPVSVGGRLTNKQILVHDDRLIPGLRRLVEAIHAEGAKVVMQLTHSGARGFSDIIGAQPAGPWTVMPLFTDEVPRPLTIAEMKEIVVSFGEAAHRAMEAGFDSVELHGAHGYLLCQFLSPHTNQRNDAYGGDLEGRLAFPLEVVKEVKTRLGDNIPLFYRFGAEDIVEGGLTVQEGKLAAPYLERAGVDVFDVTAGLAGYGENPIGERTFTEQGYFVPLAQGIKETVKAAVIGVGKITEPEYADSIVREEKVDLVAVGRLLLSNPEFPKQAAEKLGVKL